MVEVDIGLIERRLVIVGERDEVRKNGKYQGLGFFGAFFKSVF